MDKLQAPHTDSSQIAFVQTATFPVLNLGRNNDISIPVLQKHAEDKMGRYDSDEGLWKLTRPLKLILQNTRVLLSLFLKAQNIAGKTLLECPYPPFFGYQSARFSERREGKLLYGDCAGFAAQQQEWLRFAKEQTPEEQAICNTDPDAARQCCPELFRLAPSGPNSFQENKIAVPQMPPAVDAG